MDLTRTRRTGILAVLFTGVLMGALDIAIIGPAFPAVREAFGVDERRAAWMITLYVLANLVGTPLMAKLSDRYGRRAVYVADLGIFGAGSLLVALAPSFGVVLAGRAVQGLGAGGIFPVASAVIGDVFPPEKRGSALGLIGAVFGVAFLIGPILGGVLLLLGWQWLFLINIPIALGAMVAALRVLPSAAPAEPRPFDWSGMVVLAAMLAALAFALNRLEADAVLAGLGGAGVWPLLALSLLLGLVFPLVEGRAADPVIRPGLFRSRQVVLASGLAAGAGLAEAAVIFVPALLVTAHGVSTSTASFMLLPVVAAMAVGAPLFGRLLDRVGSRLVVLASSVLLAAGLWLLGASPATLLPFYLAGFAIGLGMAGLLGSSLRYVMLNEAPPSDRGAAQGILTVFISIGQLVGSALFGAVIASRGSGVGAYGTAFLVAGALLTPLVLLSLGLRSRASERRRMAAE